MVEFKTIKAEYVKFGRNNFIEIARKKAIGDNGDREFLSIARGFYMSDSEDDKRWKASITLPGEKEKIDEIVKLLKSI